MPYLSFSVTLEASLKYFQCSLSYVLAYFHTQQALSALLTPSIAGERIFPDSYAYTYAVRFLPSEQTLSGCTSSPVFSHFNLILSYTQTTTKMATSCLLGGQIAIYKPITRLYIELLDQF